MRQIIITTHWNCIRKMELSRRHGRPMYTLCSSSTPKISPLPLTVPHWNPNRNEACLLGLHILVNWPRRHSQSSASPFLSLSHYLSLFWISITLSIASIIAPFKHGGHARNAYKEVWHRGVLRRKREYFSPTKFQTP